MYKCPEVIRAFVDFIGEAAQAAIPYRKILYKSTLPEGFIERIKPKK